jgi:hypothetical protein
MRTERSQSQYNAPFSVAVNAAAKSVEAQLPSGRQFPTAIDWHLKTHLDGLARQSRFQRRPMRPDDQESRSPINSTIHEGCSTGQAK